MLLNRIRPSATTFHVLVRSPAIRPLRVDWCSRIHTCQALGQSSQSPYKLRPPPRNPLSARVIHTQPSYTNMGGAKASSTVNSTERLSALRELMSKEEVDA